MSESPIPVLRFPTGDPIVNFARAFCAPKPQAQIYPGYMAMRIRLALEADAKIPGDDRIIEPGTIRSETVGDCRHAVLCRDFAGAEYRIDVECTRHADGWTPHRLRPGNTAGERIRRMELALSAIQEAAEGLAALNQGNNATALLIASLAKETLANGGRGQ